MIHTAIVIYFAVEVVIYHWAVRNIKLARAYCAVAEVVLTQVVMNFTQVLVFLAVAEAIFRSALVCFRIGMGMTWVLACWWALGLVAFLLRVRAIRLVLSSLLVLLAAGFTVMAVYMVTSFITVARYLSSATIVKILSTGFCTQDPSGHSYPALARWQRSLSNSLSSQGRGRR